ncbi:MAG: hypothetical protein OXG15_12370 [Gammaproteobacteria bacterium]|nr:hypothetical protein [Gammaproteobacteria bacterium]
MLCNELDEFLHATQFSNFSNTYAATFRVVCLNKHATISNRFSAYNSVTYKHDIITVLNDRLALCESWTGLNEMEH